MRALFRAWNASGQISPHHMRNDVQHEVDRLAPWASKRTLANCRFAAAAAVTTAIPLLRPSRHHIDLHAFVTRAPISQALKRLSTISWQALPVRLIHKSEFNMNAKKRCVIQERCWQAVNYSWKTWKSDQQSNPETTFCLVWSAIDQTASMLRNVCNSMQVYTAIHNNVVVWWWQCSGIAVVCLHCQLHTVISMCTPCRSSCLLLRRLPLVIA